MSKYERLNDFIDTVKPRDSNSKFEDYYFARDIRDAGHTAEVDLQPSINLIYKILDFGLTDGNLVDWRDNKAFTDDEWAEIEIMSTSTTHKRIKPRLNDLLWTEKKDYNAAKIAVDGYTKLYSETFDTEHWPTCFSYIHRAINIALSINAANDVMNFILKEVQKINGKDMWYLSIKLIELLVEQRYALDTCLQLVDNIIDNPVEKPQKGEAAYKLKTKILNKLGRTKDAVATQLDLAKYYEEYAEQLYEAMGEDFARIAGVRRFYEQALRIYRQHSREKFELVQSKLKPIRELQMKNMASIPYEIPAVFQEEYSKLLADASLEEAILYFALEGRPVSKEKLKADVIKQAREHPLMEMVNREIYDERGHRVASFSSLNINNPESTPEGLSQRMCYNANQHNSIKGVMLQIMVDMMNDKFDISEEKLSFLVEDSPVIPDNCKSIILHGIALGFKQQYVLSANILAPQIENMLRRYAELLGENVSTYENDGSEEAKTLGSILDLLEKHFDDDYMFHFRCTLTEKLGGNIRNLVAHGLLTKNNLAILPYFLAFTIWLCIVHSTDILNIYAEEIVDINPIPG